MPRYDVAGLQYENDSGEPLISGELYFYEPGTTTEKTTYSDSAETIANAHPVVLTAAGRSPDVYFTGNARLIIKDSAGSTVVDKDPVSPSVSGGVRSAFSSWNTDTEYTDSEIVTASDDLFYKCVVSSSQGTNPTSGGQTDWVEIRFIQSGAVSKFSKGADVASGSALAVLSDGNFFDVTGTTTINTIDTLGVGTWIRLQFDGALTLTHHATNLVLPGGANITTAAGDTADFVEYAAGDWICTNYQRASGAPVSLQSLSESLNGADNTVSRVNLLDYGEVTNEIGSIGGGVQDIDLELGNAVSATVDTSTTTFTFSNPTASDEHCGFVLYLTDGGSQTVNWPASVDWANGTAPTLTASGLDVLVFTTLDGGTRWIANLVGQAYA